MDRKAPQICRHCQKIKKPELGKFLKRRDRYNSWYWVCLHCLDKPKAWRMRRTNESPVERVVRSELISRGYWVAQEYPLGPFRYDFAIPALRAIVEVDSRTYHSHPSRKARDRVKTAQAESAGWTVCRVRAGSELRLKLRIQIEEIENSLFTN